MIQWIQSLSAIKAIFSWLKTLFAIEEEKPSGYTAGEKTPMVTSTAEKPARKPRPKKPRSKPAAPKQ